MYFAPPNPCDCEPCTEARRLLAQRDLGQITPEMLRTCRAVLFCKRTGERSPTSKT